MRRPLRRRRGATFTMVALMTSTLLMVSAGVFMRSTGQVLELVGLETRRARVREAAFAGVAWAQRDAATGKTEGAATLELDDGVSVAVAYRPLGDGLQVTASVSPQSGDATLVLVATLARDGERWALTRFD